MIQRLLAQIQWELITIALTRYVIPRPEKATLMDEKRCEQSVFDPEGITACSLGIADVEHIEDVTMDNLAIFSTNRNCVNARDTYFEVSFNSI